MISSPVVAPRLVGRDDECAFLMRRLDETVRGGGTCATRVEGDPGMGKTRLLAEVRRRLRELQALVVDARGLERVKEPYAPFVLGIARALGAVTLGPHDRADMQAIADGLDPAAPLPKTARLASIVAAARRLVRRRPLALIVDDAHWVDDASLDLIALLADELAPEAFFVVVAARPEGRAAIEQRLHGAHAVALRALADRDVATLLREALRDRGSVGADRVRRIVALAEGNPLYALELLRNALVGGDDAATPSIAYPIVERWQSLDDDARETLLLAAVLGEIDVAGVAAVAGASANAVEDALERAARVHLVVRDAGGRWRFHHGLARAAIEAMLPLRRRPEVHRNIGALLESRDGVESARLAYHWRFAGDAERTLKYDEAAGDRARALHDYRAALGFFESAVRTGLADAAGAARLQEKLAATALGDGAADAARAPLDAALHAYAELHDARAEARILLLRSRLRWFDGLPREALLDAQRALALVEPGGPSALLFAVRVRLAQIHQLAGRSAEAQHQLDAADAIREHGDAERNVVFLNTRAMLRADAWDDRFVEDYAEAIGLAERIGHVELVVSTKNNLGLNAFLTGQRSQALAALESSIATSYEFGLRWHVSNDLLSLARVRHVFGDVAGARAAFLDALASGAEARRLAAWSFAYGVPIALDAGDRELLHRLEGTMVLERTLAGGDRAEIAYVVCAQTRLLHARGADDAIPALLTSALDALGPDAQPLFLCADVARFGLNDDLVRARALLDAHPRDVSRAAEVALFDAYAARRGRRRGEAVRFAALAAERYGALGWVLQRAQALELAERYADALRIYREAGSAGDLERLEAEQRSDDPLDALTPREREVASLALAGRSNREIAELLGLSDRTVGNHLQSVFNRLGINSRRELGELAATAARP